MKDFNIHVDNIYGICKNVLNVASASDDQYTQFSFCSLICIKWMEGLNEQRAYKRGGAGPNPTEIYSNNTGRQLCIYVLNDCRDARHRFHAVYTLYTNFIMSLSAR